MKLTDRQGFCLMTCFLLGNVLSGIGGTNNTEKTGYLSVFLSFLYLLVLIYVYHIIRKQNPKKDFFTLLETSFGTVGGKILLGLIAVFALFAALLSIANYLEFLKVSTYGKSPELPATIVVLFLAWYFGSRREKTLGRYAEIVLPVVLIAVVVLCFYGAKECRMEHLVPVTSAKSFFAQSISIFVAPFSEIVFVYLLFDRLKNQHRITKIALLSCGGVVLIFSGIYLLNLLVLGKELMAAVPFPTFYAASVVQIGTLMNKAETLITFSYTFCDLLYSGACIFLFSKASERLFHRKKGTKKITAAIAVIFLFVMLQILQNQIALDEMYSMATLVMTPFTLGLPLLMLCAVSFKKANTKGRFLQSCNTDEPKQ